MTKAMRRLLELEQALMACIREEELEPIHSELAKVLEQLHQATDELATAK